MTTFVLPIPISGTVGSGSGGGEAIPGPAGKSAYQLAVQQGFVGTLEEWLASIPGADGIDGQPGADGVDGKSVELQKSATAIQWRQEGGEFTDLVPLDDIRGPGAEQGNGYMDIGDVRIVWGVADSSGVDVEVFSFPASFATIPSVVISRLTTGQPLAASGVTLSGFNIERTETYRNAAPFSYTAIGRKAGTTPEVPGFNLPNLPVWSAAVRAQRSGKKQARILCIGDSTTAGHGANAAGMVSNSKANSYPKLLADLITQRGSRSNWQNFVGTHAAASFNAFDNRVTSTAAWTATVGARTAGGPTYESKGTTNLTFAPTEAWDTAEFLYTRVDPVNGTGLIVSINGVDYGTYLSYKTPNGPVLSDPIIVKANSIGPNTLSFRGVNATNAFLLGVLTYRSDQKDTLVLNAGWSGATAANWLLDRNISYGPLPVIEYYNPDLVIINLGINDVANAGNVVTEAAYRSQMQEIITASRKTGADVVLVIPNDCSPSDLSGRLNTLAGWVTSLGSTNGVPVIDLRSKLGNYAAANASGYMRDTLHPTALGYAKIAEAIADVIMPVSAG